MKRYICTDKCFHNGSLYRKGDLAVFGDDFPKDKEGNIRHFELADQSVAAPSGPEKGRGGVIVNGKKTAE
jgi:hypothetical protein